MWLIGVNIPIYLKVILRSTIYRGILRFIETNEHYNQSTIETKIWQWGNNCLSQRSLSGTVVSKQWRESSSYLSGDKCGTVTMPCDMSRFAASPATAADVERDKPSGAGFSILLLSPTTLFWWFILNAHCHPILVIQADVNEIPDRLNWICTSV